MASLARAAILPTDLESKIGAYYEPVDADARAIWRSKIGSNRRLAARPGA